MNRKVAIYARVSTEHEAQLSALDNQVQYYDDILDKHPNWILYDRYIDEGITGTSIKKRKNFIRMMKDAHEGKFDLIITREVSRFAIAYPGDDDLESVGSIFEDLDCKVVDADIDGVGEIVVKGDCVFLGYTDKSLTKRVFDKEGYFHTGDLGYIKGNKIFLKGRKKKMLLTSNGENVDAETIKNRIKEKDKNIVEVKAYIKNDKIAVNIYVKNDIDSSIIDKYNEEVPKYERISSFTIYKDSIDTRLKD